MGKSKSIDVKCGSRHGKADFFRREMQRFKDAGHQVVEHKGYFAVFENPSANDEERKQAAIERFCIEECAEKDPSCDLFICQKCALYPFSPFNHEKEKN